jgi:hypothetical protein
MSPLTTPFGASLKKMIPEPSVACHRCPRSPSLVRQVLGGRGTAPSGEPSVKSSRSSTSPLSGRVTDSFVTACRKSEAPHWLLAAGLRPTPFAVSMGTAPTVQPGATCW